MTAFTYDAMNRLYHRDRFASVASAVNLYGCRRAAGIHQSTPRGRPSPLPMTMPAGCSRKNYSEYATQETYVHDDAGNLLNATNPAVSMSYTYDARNLQLTIVNDTIVKTVGYTYDENGRGQTLTYPRRRNHRLH